jgi:hypothetical protein
MQPDFVSLIATQRFVVDRLTIDHLKAIDAALSGGSSLPLLIH